MSPAPCGAFLWVLLGRRDNRANHRKFAADKVKQAEANRKRSEAAKAQENRANQHTAQDRPQVVDEPTKIAPRGQGSAAKATASKTNRGTVERMDRLSRDCKLQGSPA